MLAENEEGYRNLVRLTSEAALHGFYNKPRVSKEFLSRHTEGLIGFSGCLAGEVNQHLMAGKYDEAKQSAGQFEEMFGKGNFFLEVQDHGLEPDKGVCDALFKMERELNIPHHRDQRQPLRRGGRLAAPTRSCSACRPRAA